jgi:predicted heme/steroid binding protein
MTEFTAEELAANDGRDGRPAYVAFRGTVYDVSESYMWEDGDHEGAHQAGLDLTAAHEDAPHDVHVTGFPVVGTLV